MRRRWMPDAEKIRGRDAGVMDRNNGTRKAVIHTVFAELLDSPVEWRNYVASLWII